MERILKSQEEGQCALRTLKVRAPPTAGLSKEEGMERGWRNLPVGHAQFCRRELVAAFLSEVILHSHGSVSLGSEM